MGAASAQGGSLWGCLQESHHARACVLACFWCGVGQVLKTKSQHSWHTLEHQEGGWEARSTPGPPTTNHTHSHAHTAAPPHPHVLHSGARLGCSHNLCCRGEASGFSVAPTTVATTPETQPRHASMSYTNTPSPRLTFFDTHPCACSLVLPCAQTFTRWVNCKCRYNSPHDDEPQPQPRKLSPIPVAPTSSPLVARCFPLPLSAVPLGLFPCSSNTRLFMVTTHSRAAGGACPSRGPGGRARPGRGAVRDH